jgi:hypothetical protein
MHYSQLYSVYLLNLAQETLTGAAYGCNQNENASFNFLDRRLHVGLPTKASVVFTGRCLTPTTPGIPQDIQRVGPAGDRRSYSLTCFIQHGGMQVCDVHWYDCLLRRS